MNPLEALIGSIPPDGCGIEIGAHTLPVPGVAPFYLDRTHVFADITGKIDVQADAVALPIPDGELDYVCSSHVLEHLPNPITALFEWGRVLRQGGVLYLVVPDKRFTFDHLRAVTSSRHLVEDFRANVTNADEAHVREFIYGIDWDRTGTPIHPEGPEKHKQSHLGLYLGRIAAGQAVDIHYHTFTPESLVDLLYVCGLLGGFGSLFELVSRAERFPPERGDGVALLLRARRKTNRERRATFELAHPRGGSRALRLVCPQTLAPLRVQPTIDGRHVLRSLCDATEYVVENGVPNLVPERFESLRRPWLGWSRRFWIAARLKLMRPQGALRTDAAFPNAVQR